MPESQKHVLRKVVDILREHFAVDSVYLYGSRARGTALPDSDWDLAVLFTHWLKDPVDRFLRPQQAEEVLQRELELYGKVSVVDLEIVPPALQWSIINGLRIYDRNVPHVRRIEQSVVSKIEKDYAPELFAVRDRPSNPPATSDSHHEP